jgi:hypothetical protein
MSWFEKIVERQNAPDDSRDLRKGEVKELLLSSFKEVLPDFEFTTYKNNTYYFLRTKTFRGLELHETLNVLVGLKNKNISCSIASVLNKTYLFNSNYSNGFLSSHADLLATKSGSGVSNIEDSYYWHNRKIETVKEVIRKIALDFKEYGLQYLDLKHQRLHTSDLIRHGLDFIEKLMVDKGELRREIEKEINNAQQVVSRLKHPIFIQLRDKLQSIPNQSRDDRQRIARLTFELIELYYER